MTTEQPETPAAPGPAEPPNPAREMYHEWKKRAEMHVGQPYAPPYPPPGAMPPYPPPQMMPPYPAPGAMPPYPPPQMMPPYPPAGMWPPAPYPPAAPGKSAGSTESLFESLGSLVRLGVEAMNAGLAGGIGLMRGFAGPAGYEPDPWAAYPGYGPHGCGCQGHCQGCEAAGPGEWDCHPRVRGCY
jgi:hypothetical protein